MESLQFCLYTARFLNASWVKLGILFYRHTAHRSFSTVAFLALHTSFSTAQETYVSTRKAKPWKTLTRDSHRFLSLSFPFFFAFYWLSARSSNRDLISSKKSRVRLLASSGDMPRGLIKVGQDEISRYALLSFSLTLLPSSPFRSDAFLSRIKEKPRLVHPCIHIRHDRDLVLYYVTGTVCR